MAQQTILSSDSGSQAAGKINDNFTELYNGQGGGGAVPSGIIALNEDAVQRIRTRKHYQSYRFGLRGWSNYRLIAMEIPTGREAHNRLGRDLPRLLSNVRQSD